MSRTGSSPTVEALPCRVCATRSAQLARARMVLVLPLGQVGGELAHQVVGLLQVDVVERQPDAHRANHLVVVVVAGQPAREAERQHVAVLGRGQHGGLQGRPAAQEQPAAPGRPARRVEPRRGPAARPAKVDGIFRRGSGRVGGRIALARLAHGLGFGHQWGDIALGAGVGLQGDGPFAQQVVRVVQQRQQRRHGLARLGNPQVHHLFDGPRGLAVAVQADHAAGPLERVEGAAHAAQHVGVAQRVEPTGQVGRDIAEHFLGFGQEDLEQFGVHPGGVARHRRGRARRRPAPARRRASGRPAPRSGVRRPNHCRPATRAAAWWRRWPGGAARHRRRWRPGRSRPARRRAGAGSPANRRRRPRGWRPSRRGARRPARGGGHLVGPARREGVFVGGIGLTAAEFEDVGKGMHRRRVRRQSRIAGPRGPAGCRCRAAPSSRASTARVAASAAAAGSSIPSGIAALPIRRSSVASSPPNAWAASPSVLTASGRAALRSKVSSQDSPLSSWARSRVTASARSAWALAVSTIAASQSGAVAVGSARQAASWSQRAANSAADGWPDWPCTRHGMASARARNSATPVGPRAAPVSPGTARCWPACGN